MLSNLVRLVLRIYVIHSMIWPLENSNAKTKAKSSRQKENTKRRCIHRRRQHQRGQDTREDTLIWLLAYMYLGTVSYLGLDKQ
jgi:hypothetical protein